MYCKKCGNEIRDDAVVCIHCGCSTQETPTATKDAPSTGMAVLGFFIPLAGLIVWLINKENKPLFAKSAGKGALIGWIISMVFSIIYAVIMVFMFV